MLDAKYVIAPSLEMCFRDKTTGLPLRDGWVFAFKDNERTVPKTMYYLSGEPGDYEYKALPNPCQLTGIGTFSDGNGNDIIPYWYPFDSFEDDAKVELYYIVVTDINADLLTPEFVRQAWPNFISTGGSEDQNANNFVANGQFSLHNSIASLVAPSVTSPVGNISLPITQIAPGGWTFERPVGSVSIDNVTFPPFGSYVDVPDKSPKYACKVICTSPSLADNKKDLSVQWPDVNKFSTPTDVGQEYTYAISSQLNIGSSLTVSLYLIKNFGIGGSATTEELLTTFDLTSSLQIFYYAFTFGNNSGKTIGTSGDYVQLAIRFPNQSFNVSITDVLLVQNNVVITQFPETTDAEFNALSLAGYVPPQIDSSSIGLPAIRTLPGLGFDTSQVGNIVQTIRKTPKFGELLTDGSSYITSAYSSDGIPYSRLQAELFDSTYLVPSCGTGFRYMTAILTSNQQIILTQNATSQLAMATDGAISTGFSFSTTCTSVSTNATGSSCPSASTNNSANIINFYQGVAGTPVAGGGFIANINVIRIGTLLVPQVVNILFTNTMVGGNYFTFDTTTLTGTPLLYYIWYSVNGTPAVPPVVPGRTPIQVDIISAVDNLVNYAQKTANAISSLATTSIRSIAASGMTAGAYFTIITAQGSFAVWYKIAGMGSAPVLVNTTYIEVTLSGSETNTQVANATVRAINSYQFATPYMAGQVIRARDLAQGIDANAANRFSYVPGYGGDLTATYEWDDFGYHNHEANTQGLIFGGGDSNFTPPGSGAATQTSISFRGESETTMKNISMNFYIKY